MWCSHKVPGPQFEYLARRPRPVDHTSSRTGRSQAGWGLSEQRAVVIVWPREEPGVRLVNLQGRVLAGRLASAGC